MSAKKFIPYGRQCIDEEDIQAVAEVLRSDFLTTGPAVAEFEAALAKVAGTPYAVAIANGTAALHAAVAAAGIGPGDEVITSPITFAASANCASVVLTRCSLARLALTTISAGVAPSRPAPISCADSVAAVVSPI